MTLNSIRLTIDDKYPTTSYYVDINEGEKYINTTISHCDSYPEMTNDKLACTHLANKICIWLNDQSKERFDSIRNLLYKAIKQQKALEALKGDFS